MGLCGNLGLWVGWGVFCLWVWVIFVWVGCFVGFVCGGLVLLVLRFALGWWDCFDLSLVVGLGFWFVVYMICGVIAALFGILVCWNFVWVWWFCLL